jgi:hypothetical protein
MCGIMSRMTDHDQNPERGVLDVLLGALTGSALLPFLQAIATKSGEDVYAKIKDALPKRHRQRVMAEIKESDTVTLYSADTRIVLRMPAKTTAAMTEQLKQVRLPPRRDEWLRISWDRASSRWVVHKCDPPSELAG